MQKIKSSKIAETSFCAHCGDICQVQHITYNHHNFCCEGCKTVFEILHNNNLCEYYELNSQVGIKIPKTNFGEKYGFLDVPEIGQKLLVFSSNTVSKAVFYVPNIHCSSCIWLLENLQKLNDGILHSTVNFPKRELTFAFSPQKTSLRKVVELLATLGYEPAINLSESTKKNEKNVSSKLALQIGVAGFAFGNIMLMSLPEYLNKGDVQLADFQTIFAAISIILTLPVLLFSATDYYKSAYKGLKSGYLNIDVPIVIGIFALIFQSLYEVFTKTGQGYFDSLAGLLFFLLVGKWFQQKTYQGLSFERDFKSYFPLAATKIATNSEVTVLVNSLKKDDEIIIKNEELIPCDSTIIDGIAHIDYSFVTGEADLITKQQGEFVYAGGKHQGERIKVRVEKEVSQSYLTDLWSQNVFKANTNKAYKLFIDQVSRYFTLTMLIIAALAGTTWFFIDSSKAIYVVTSVLIVACPCALALSMPFTMGNALRILSKKGFYAKSAETIEDLSTTDTIVFDKTGTLTENKQAFVIYNGEKLTEFQTKAIKSISANSNHPLSKAINNYLEAGITKVTHFNEFPGKGISGNVNEIFVKLGSADFVGKVQLNKSTQNTQVYCSFNGNVLGYFEIKKQYRKGLMNLIQQLLKKYHIHLLSGDSDAERSFLEKIFPNKSLLNFNQSPQNKLNYIEKLQAMGHNTIMIGDGLNDAGALKKATVGISISDDVYHFSPACDVILDAQKFNQLNEFIEFSKKSMRVVKWCLVLSFLYNVLGLSIAVSGNLSPLIAAVLMPLSSITVVIFATVATNLTAKKILV